MTERPPPAPPASLSRGAQQMVAHVTVIITTNLFSTTVIILASIGSHIAQGDSRCNSSRHQERREEKEKEPGSKAACRGHHRHPFIILVPSHLRGWFPWADGKELGRNTKAILIPARAGGGGGVDPGPGLREQPSSPELKRGSHPPRTP